jgi:glycosyltransferase involved in cell wall biosynthesis
MRVLLLSAYDACSHRQWRESVVDGLADWDWQVLSLPPRHFSWRVRGNPLYWSIAERKILEAEYDLVLATSMVDLATLRGLVPRLTRIPTLLYFHENQFAYPESRAPHGLLESQMCSIYSALAADGLLFNSAYNLETFLEGCEKLLRKLPDYTPQGLREILSEKSRVLPVPVEVPAVAAPVDKQKCLQLVWNHRWEYDKGPGQLLELAAALLERGLDFTLHVVGQQFREQPAVFAELRALLEGAGALGHWGFIEERENYFALLAACDVVLSTAEHDFQGLAVMEACAQACTPLVPDRLVYPEYFESVYRYQDNAEAVDKLLHWSEMKVGGQSLPRVDMEQFSPTVLLEQYRGLLHSQAQRNSVS